MHLSRRLSPLRLPSAPPLRLQVVAALGVAAMACKSDYEQKSLDPVVVDDTALTEPFSNDWGQWLSMAILADGSPAVAYYDTTMGAAGFAVGAFSGGGVSWSHEEPDGYVGEDGLDRGDRGAFTSMVVGADGVVWMSYQDVSNHNLRFASRATDGTWTNNLADGGSGTGSGGAGYFTSINLDGAGNPVITHYDKGSAALRVAHYFPSTGMFQGEVVDEGTGYTPPEGSTESAKSADVGAFSHIDVAAGIEYIAYYDAANGDLKLAWGTTGSYTVETVDAEGDVGQWPDMRIIDGKIEIAYHDVGNQDLKYAIGEPGAWTIETVDSGAYVGADTALFTSGSYPAILYYDGDNKDMKMAWRSSGGWENRLVTNDDGKALGFFNEVVEASGRHYAGCYDYTNHTLWFEALD